MKGLKFIRPELGIDEYEWVKAVIGESMIDDEKRRPVAFVGMQHGPVDMVGITCGSMRALSAGVVCYNPNAHIHNGPVRPIRNPIEYEYFENKNSLSWMRDYYGLPDIGVAIEKNPFSIPYNDKEFKTRMSTTERYNKLGLINIDNTYVAYAIRMVRTAKIRYPKNAKIFSFLEATKPEEDYSLESYLRVTRNFYSNFKKMIDFEERYNGSLFRKVEKYGPVKKK